MSISRLPSSATAQFALLRRFNTLGISVSMLSPFIAGVRDSLSLHQIVRFLASSREIRRLTANCVILNGVILVGSIAIFKYVVYYIFTFLYSFIVPAGLDDTLLIYKLMHTAFIVLWVLPIYLISLFANTVWYQDIATNAFMLRHINP